VRSERHCQRGERGFQAWTAGRSRIAAAGALA
jgi:hypothetical protein